MIEKFIEIANLSGVEVKIVKNIDFLNEFGLNTSLDYDSNKDVGFIKALSGATESASAVINIPKREKLKSILTSKTLYISVENSSLRSTLSEAYFFAKQKCQDEYMLFISGESKTADIEKTLVSGVQGPEKIIFLILDKG
ncbi:L-lactate dehydrogenase complex protein LldG [Thermodesulfobium acidiphilum]|uniref:L-lactate dehydrogenase complex protein LldG n=1 Tax=Thermodesulfobium acidiphilum TaxID=1794699 RepID=A0A2R4W0G7_THEAF|nr:LUD domain-containing protein [Thermodesulfobium acidiphilum]AWB10265.1 L-lactate dehydrogenase complex protein LldG [Thermodesulfobium acidiphilum]